MSVKLPDLKDFEQLLDRKLSELEQRLTRAIEIRDKPTLDINECAKVMNCTNQTARKRLREAGIKMNEDARPMIVESKSFYKALWSGKIKS